MVPYIPRYLFPVDWGYSWVTDNSGQLGEGHPLLPHPWLSQSQPWDPEQFQYLPKPTGCNIRDKRSVSWNSDMIDIEIVEAVLRMIVGTVNNTAMLKDQQC